MHSPLQIGHHARLVLVPPMPEWLCKLFGHKDTPAVGS